MTDDDDRREWRFVYNNNVLVVLRIYILFCFVKIDSAIWFGQVYICIYILRSIWKLCARDAELLFTSNYLLVLP